MFSKYKLNKKYVIIAIIGFIALWFLFRPKTEFEACYSKCTGLAYYPVDGKCSSNQYLRNNTCYMDDRVCLAICAKTK